MKVEQIDYADAPAFLADLRPTNARWDDPVPLRRSWVFRGHADANWPLLPNLWRADASVRTKPWWDAARALATPFVEDLSEFAKGAMRSVDVAAKQERKIEAVTAFITELSCVFAFAELANELGLAVGELPSPPERVLANQDFGQLHLQWPLFWPNATTAIAQHHRVPTRLLDWTRRPLVAAFFAASEAAGQPEVQHLAVWATRASDIPTNARIEQFPFPRHKNDFLRAQDGLFLYDSENDTQYVNTGSRRCMSQVLTQDCNVRVFKLVLPTSEAAALLRLLLVERVSRAHLMPTYDNVANTIMQSPLLF